MAPRNRNMHFEILVPADWTAQAVFNSPHSGRDYPPEFLAASRLTPDAMRKSEDCYVDELFMGCVAHGAPMLRSHTPRSFIDFNREPYELDPRMFADTLPGYVNTTSPRVMAGLGTIPRVVAEGEDIYRAPLSFAEALARIDLIYRPYHRTLTALMDELVAKSGSGLLLDCHSMPSTALGHTGPVRADVVLGDRYGASCSRAVTAFVDELMRGEGLRVLRNKPYAGGFITHSHGAPLSCRHALQVEVNRGLYVNEKTMEKSRDFHALRTSFSNVSGKLLAALGDLFAPAEQRLAAE